MAMYRTPSGGSEKLPDQIDLSAASTLNTQHHNSHFAHVEKGAPSINNASLAESEDPQTAAVKVTPPPPLDWNGPDDPDNPHNWPTWRRVYITFATALLGFSVTFGSSVYSPAVPEIMEQFHVGPTLALLPLGLWVLGLGFGPMLAAPISETAGRLVVYRVSVPLSMLFTLGAGFSQTFAQLTVLRFFGGFFGSPVLAVGAGSNTDVWPPKARAAATALFAFAPFLGPALGPFVGGFSAMNKGWRWTQWDILFVTLAAYLISLPMTETYKKIILKKRAKRQGVDLPRGPPPKAMIKVLFTVTLATPVRMLCTEPIVAWYSLYVAFNFAVLFAFFAAFPIVFEGVYHFNAGESGLTFLAVGLGCVFAVITAVVVDRVWYQREQRKAVAEGRNAVAPEHRLYAAMLGSFGLPIGLFWFAWTARADVYWISPVLASIPFAWGNLCVFVSAALYLVDTYGPMGGASALAANGLLRYTLGCVFPLFTVQMYDKLGIAWATSVFGFISLAMLPIPWVLFKMGKRIRARSSFDTIKA